MVSKSNRISRIVAKKCQCCPIAMFIKIWYCYNLCVCPYVRFEPINSQGKYIWEENCASINIRFSRMKKVNFLILNEIKVIIRKKSLKKIILFVHEAGVSLTFVGFLTPPQHGEKCIKIYLYVNIMYSIYKSIYLSISFYKWLYEKNLSKHIKIFPLKWYCARRGGYYLCWKHFHEIETSLLHLRFVIPHRCSPGQSPGNTLN